MGRERREAPQIRRGRLEGRRSAAAAGRRGGLEGRRAEAARRFARGTDRRRGQAAPGNGIVGRPRIGGTAQSRRGRLEGRGGTALQGSSGHLEGRRGAPSPRRRSGLEIGGAEAAGRGPCHLAVADRAPLRADREAGEGLSDAAGRHHRAPGRREAGRRRGGLEDRGSRAPARRPGRVGSHHARQRCVAGTDRRTAAGGGRRSRAEAARADARHGREDAHPRRRRARGSAALLAGSRRSQARRRARPVAGRRGKAHRGSASQSRPRRPGADGRGDREPAQGRACAGDGRHARLHRCHDGGQCAAAGKGTQPAHRRDGEPVAQFHGPYRQRGARRRVDRVRTAHRRTDPRARRGDRPPGPAAGRRWIPRCRPTG